VLPFFFFFFFPLFFFLLRSGAFEIRNVFFFTFSLPPLSSIVWPAAGRFPFRWLKILRDQVWFSPSFPFFFLAFIEWDAASRFFPLFFFFSFILVGNFFSFFRAALFPLRSECRDGYLSFFFASLFHGARSVRRCLFSSSFLFLGRRAFFFLFILFFFSI